MKMIWNESIQNLMLLENIIINNNCHSQNIFEHDLMIYYNIKLIEHGVS
jgi:hypothetical protein